MLRGEEGARKHALSGSPLSTSGVAAKLERGVGGVRTPRRGLDKLNADGVCDGRSALRNVMNGQVERGEPERASFLAPPALKASLVRETNASSPTLPVGIGGSDVTSVQEERASGERKRVFCL